MCIEAIATLTEHQAGLARRTTASGGADLVDNRYIVLLVCLQACTLSDILGHPSYHHIPSQPTANLHTGYLSLFRSSCKKSRASLAELSSSL